MEEDGIVVLDEGVEAREVAAAAGCCTQGAPATVRTPDS